MSGIHDRTPASHRPSRGSRTDDDRQQRPVPNRLQNLQNLLNSERHIGNSVGALDTLRRELEEYRGRSSILSEEVRADLDRESQQIQVERQNWNQYQDNGSTAGTVRPGDQRPQALSVTVGDSEGGASYPTWSDRTRSLAELYLRAARTRNANLRSLLNLLGARIESVTPQQSEGESSMDHWRAKRRKLESDDHREGLQNFRYGQYGQVVPGALKMELASCDGGTYEPDGESSWPENILRNDATVYCTKSNRCNLILKHHAGIPFCLNKIVIKAPRIGYDAPIQEGMVFVSMTSDDLLARTAASHIQCEATRRPQRNRHSGMQPSQEYLNAHRPRLPSLRDATLDAGLRSEGSETDGGNLPRPILRGEPDPVPEFRTITNYDEQSDERSEANERDYDNDETPYLTVSERLGTNRFDDDDDDDAVICSDSSESSSEGDTSEMGTFPQRRRALSRQIRAMRRRWNATHPRHRPISPDPPSGPHHEVSEPLDPTLMKPHARFHIKRHKSMVSIKFDPPPSGRYILIKLWNPHSGKNIDIQSIVAYGYGGPRFFPAGGFR
ncbi:uncharacterized protein BO97DRAFT_416323 [Aspergillus homomorphus CBS 101889]|uniref:Uncharacterized protein n=1 Tax=Aspergillus homomorphus (strain CBS 101889) TaxID=1450537 RepID=A0A395HQN8_ASPHC|nr:hypothetical protein BO97DRAFT_416323 [Aspergillus homomorphus CBS 101889]RAL10060.1 hypothetical protein BO97DRAFT_416323 [Aspergillus homomorphus CBS 101889]